MATVARAISTTAPIMKRVLDDAVFSEFSSTSLEGMFLSCESCAVPSFAKADDDDDDDDVSLLEDCSSPRNRFSIG